MALIVIGHHRSGTSLLRSLCTSHPDITVTREFGNFFVLNQPFGVYARYILKRWWEKRNAPFAPQPWPAGYKVKGVNVLHNFAFITHYLQRVHKHSGDIIDVPVIEAALRDLFPATRVVGDKYPDHWFQLDELSETNGLNCLFIYRDPRDLASSVVAKARTEWRESWPESLRDVRTVAERWVNIIEIMNRNAGKIYIVRYEDLVTRPKAVLQGIGTWLNVDPDGFAHEMVQPTSVGKHQSGLSTDEIAAITEIAGPAMRQLGYEV